MHPVIDAFDQASVGEDVLGHTLAPVATLLGATKRIAKAAGGCLQLRGHLGCLLELVDYRAVLARRLLLEVGDHLFDALHLATHVLALLLDDGCARVVLLLTELQVGFQTLGALLKASVELFVTSTHAGIELFGAFTHTSVELLVDHFAGSCGCGFHGFVPLTGQRIDGGATLDKRSPNRSGNCLLRTGFSGGRSGPSKHNHKDVKPEGKAEEHGDDEGEQVHVANSNDGV